MTLSVDNLISGLLSDVDKQKEKKKDRKKRDVEKITYTFDEPTLKTTRLVLIVHVYKCQCGSLHKVPNAHVLTEKVDKHGNKKLTRYLCQTDISGAKRETEEQVVNVAACHECFGDAKLSPVVSDDAKNDIEDAGDVLDLEGLLEDLDNV